MFVFYSRILYHNKVNGISAFKRQKFTKNKRASHILSEALSENISHGSKAFERKLFVKFDRNDIGSRESGSDIILSVWISWTIVNRYLGGCLLNVFELFLMWSMLFYEALFGFRLSVSFPNVRIRLLHSR